MNKFSFISPKTLTEARKQVTATAPQIATGKTIQGAAVIKAGGVDLLDLMKTNIIRPDKIVSINSIPELDKIEFAANKGLKIGALVKLADIEHHAEIKKHYRALHQSVAHAATPQIRNMATMGGNLAQRPRCWYFRSAEHKCLKKGGDVCFAKNGQNQIHGIFDTDICPCVHSSSVATALMAFAAQVEVTGANGKQRMVKLADFFVLPATDPTRENVLEAGEIITAVVLPQPNKNQRSYYIKQAAKESYDWALADTAVVVEMDGNVCKKASIILGAAAPTPKHATAAERALVGQKINAEAAAKAGKMATEGATPLAHNAYKVPMFQAIVKECITKLA